MPFGLSNVLSTFQALMNETFRSYLRMFVLVFFYDILVYSADFPTHLGHLRLWEVLRISKHDNLVVDRKKSFWSTTTTVFGTYYFHKWSLSGSCQNNKHG